jgi:leader peptidase (prepilin peptidase)/N-methyltransferase
VSPDLFIGTAVTILGLIMGSAVTALSWRVPRGESWVHGRSRCPKCGHVLGVLDLFPVLSWLASRGRCRHCGVRVSARYPFIEATCGAWALLAWRHLGLAPALPLVAIWGFLLVALVWIDLDFQLLPDVLTLPGTLLAVVAALLGPGPRHAMFGMLVGAGLLWLVSELYFRVRRIEGMGFGDVKLGAMFGALLGGPLSLVTIFLAAFAGSAVGLVMIARGRGGMKTALPFGLFLAPAAMIAYLWGGGWLAAYTRLLHP